MPLATIAGAPAQSPKSSDSAPALLVPFTRAATEHIEGFLDTTFAAVTGSTQPIAPTDIPAYGFMRGIFIEVAVTGGTGTAATYYGDAPFNILQDITLSDVNGAPIVGPIDGYDLYQINKLGGYRRMDAKKDTDFVAPTTAGNFTFLLYIPIEVNSRDGLGSLANMNAASAYKLRASIAPLNTVYSANPTGIPTVRVRAWLDAWTQPAATDLQGNPCATQPPAHGTTSYWSKQTFNVASGQNQLKLSRVGNYIRDLIFINRTAAGVRNASNMPAPTFISWDTRVLREYQQSVWRKRMGNVFDLSGTLDSAGALDTGVYCEDYFHEFDGKAGAELRDGWLPTTQSTRYEITGSFGAAGTFTVLTNDVSPAGEVFV